MDEYSLTILSSSKDEFISRCITLIYPEIVKSLDELYLQSQNELKNKSANTNIKSKLAIFQKVLTDIPRWTNEMVANETNKIKKNANCDYLDDLISCVFVIQLKYLSAIRPSQKSKTIQLNIPESKDFIWKVYINSAKKIYKNIYLYADASPQEALKNKRAIELLIREAILETIRDYIPMNELLKLLMEKETVQVETEVAVAPITKKRSLSFDNVDELMDDKGKKSTNVVDRENPKGGMYGSIMEEDLTPLIEQQTLPLSLNDYEELPNNCGSVSDDELEPLPLFMEDYKVTEPKVTELKVVEPKVTELKVVEDFDFEELPDIEQLEL